MFAQRTDPAANGGVGWFFTDRHGGVSRGDLASLNLGRTDRDEADRLRENLRRVGSVAGVRRVCALYQVHGAVVHQPGPPDWAPDAWLGAPITRSLPQADAAVTTEPGMALMIRVADCVPVLFADSQARVIGAAHAGRAGLFAGVIQATLTTMRDRGAARIRAWIGPHICGSCYEVPEQMAQQAWSLLPATRATTSWGTPAIDLAAGVAAICAQEQVAVTDLGWCTFEKDRFFSHRRDGAGCGRQVGAIWLADRLPAWHLRSRCSQQVV